LYSKEPNRYILTIKHRGAPGDVKFINGSNIVSASSWYFIVKTEKEEHVIPYHRVLIIEDVKERKVLWKKSSS